MMSAKDYWDILDTARDPILTGSRKRKPTEKCLPYENSSDSNHDNSKPKSKPKTKPSSKSKHNSKSKSTTKKNSKTRRRSPKPSKLADDYSSTNDLAAIRYV